MSDMFQWIRILCVGVLLISACDATLTVGGRTVGVSSGNFVFTDGYLTTNYSFPVDKVWQACEKTLMVMKASNLERKKKISSGTMIAIIQDERVQINIEYLSRDKTLVSVRIGMAGNNMASQLLHEKIANTLLEAADQENP